MVSSPGQIVPSPESVTIGLMVTVMVSLVVVPDEPET